METDEINGNIYIPDSALIVYRNFKHEYEIEHRRILASGKLGAAKPPTKSFLNAMLSEYSKTFQETPSGRIPTNMLYADSRSGMERYIWWEGPRKRYQTFTDSIGLENGEYPMPGTIYYVKNDELYMYAFEGKRPKMKSRLLMGPFFNYYNDGKVCLGNSKITMPKPLTWKNFQECWQKLFWGSENSHLISNPIRGNITVTLKECRDRGTFDTSTLTATNMTLEKLLNSVR